MNLVILSEDSSKPPCHLERSVSEVERQGDINKHKFRLFMEKSTG